MKATASPKRLKRQTPGNLRLEQRLMFDGAVADTVVDEIPLETQISSAPSPAISPVVENEVSESNLVSYPDSQPPANLESAEALTHSALHEWFSNSNYLQQAADFFSANADSTEWQTNALELQSAVLDGEYNIQVKLLDSTTLSGALGGYSSSGTDGKATIYLNEQWLSIATPEAIQSVLLEEIGHDFDHILNNGLDTAGDEGQHFSSHILNNPDNSNYQGDDHKQIDIDGILVTIEQAGLSITDSNGGDSGDISVSEDSTLTAQTFNVLPLNDVTSIEIEGVEIVGGSYPVAVPTTYGSLAVTDFNSATGVVTYSYTPTGTPFDHSSGEILDSISIDVTDSTLGTASDTLDILITDTTPTAEADTVSIEEDTATFSDNVILGGLTDDTLSADLPVTVVGLAVGATGANLSDGATLDTPLSGTYGTLEIAATGTITYTLNTAHVDVQALTRGDSINDLFTYTLSDDDGSESNALITVTINGVDEPTITITDSNAGDTGDITTQEGVELIAESFNITADDGLDRLTIEGVDITEAELLASSTTPIAITTSRGTLTVIAYNDLTDTVLYNYNSSSATPIDHRAGDVLDTISITVTDVNARTATDDLDILIEDSASIAVDDSNSLEEKASSNTVTGNAITDPAGADQLSYDVTSTVVGLAAGDTGANLVDGATIATELAGNYGTLNIQSNGAYTYTLDNDNNTVDNLSRGSSLTDTFTYTLQDADESQTNALITITINGVDEPTITITDDNAGTAGDLTNQEGVEIIDASFTISADDGFDSINIGGTDITEAELLATRDTPIEITTTRGTLTLTEYNNTTGIVLYSYITSSATPIDHRAGDPLDSISITLTDTNARIATDSLDILVQDSASVAVDDSNSIEERPATNTVTGNAITDGAGADQLSYDTPNTVVGLAAGDTSANLADAATIDTDLTGTYGTLSIQSDGSYTYTLDSDNVAVNALSRGDSLTDTFTYTLQDADESQTNALINITINGVDEPTITITDSNDTEAGDITTQEGVEISDASFTISTDDGFDRLTIESTDITEAELLAAGTTPIAITTSRGTLTVTGYNDSTGIVVYDYITSSATPIDHSTGDVLDTITITITDTNARTATDTLDILTQDSSPTAIDDVNSIEERPGADTVTGNAITDAPGADQLNFDTPSTVAGLAVGDTGSDLVDAATIATDLTGSYGTLNIQSNGDYTYTLDNSNSVVNSLMEGESLTDIYTYTLQDSDGSLSSALITITVIGTDEPVITITDSNDTADGDITTQEGVEISAASFNIEAADGLDRLTIEGTDITEAELLATTTAPISIDTSKGTLTVIAYNDTTGVVLYNYTSSIESPIDHRTGDSIDSITITVTDLNARTTSDTLDILIEDSGPTAVADSNSIEEKPAVSTVTGNAITDQAGADQSSFDTPSSIAGLAAGDTDADLVDASTVGTELSGSYGTLNIQSNGDYTYTLDNTNSDVSALAEGESLDDIFTYTLQDSDGSLSSALITITVNGVDEPVITITDSNDTADGDITTQEGVEISAASFTIEAADGLTLLTIESTAITAAELLAASTTPIAVTTTRGTLTVTDYDDSTGEVQYNYISSSATPIDHSEGDAIDSISITVTDSNARATTATLDILIEDSASIAVADSNSIEEKPASDIVTGNAITDSEGADQLSYDTPSVVAGLAVGDTDADLVDASTIGTELSGSYGTLNIQSNGDYTYTLDNANIDVNALAAGESLDDIFTYTL
ncbi:VCBS domain-containing protein, partial [Neptuniibacter sp.]|uniref:beta strand repeat-containing protein n=1 Tax=Neptuniibacter sp. TaxID=1962643 RepID=UPI00261087DA